jgi:threonine/homoserine/homoserine lactone efflux protein
MVSLSTFLIFALASLALVLVPGPNHIDIAARGIAQGRAAGVASALGVETGTMVHIAAAAAGLSYVIARSATLFNVIKWAGVAYLIYLGIRALTSRQELRTQDADPQPLRKIFLEGVIVNVLNPKVILFFLAFLPQFVDPTRGHVTAQMVVLGGIFVALAVISDGAYALLAGTAGRWLWRNPRFVRGERYVSGTVYIGLGAFTALSGSSGARTTAGT